MEFLQEIASLKDRLKMVEETLDAAYAMRGDFRVHSRSLALCSSLVEMADIFGVDEEVRFIALSVLEDFVAQSEEAESAADGLPGRMRLRRARQAAADNSQSRPTAAAVLLAARQRSGEVSQVDRTRVYVCIQIAEKFARKAPLRRPVDLAAKGILVKDVFALEREVLNRVRFIVRPVVLWHAVEMLLVGAVMGPLSSARHHSRSLPAVAIARALFRQSRAVASRICQLLLMEPALLEIPPMLLSAGVVLVALSHCWGHWSVDAVLLSCMSIRLRLSLRLR